MRLFLCSDTPRAPPSGLATLLGETRSSAVVVANALDNLSEFPRAELIEREASMLSGLGLASVELDLREYFSDPDRLADDLTGTDLVWVTGGNVFVLRDALARSGFDGLVVARLNEDSIVYGGYSAGTCVCAPTLHGLELVDDVTAVATPIWPGLRLVPFSIAPHFRSGHHEAAAINHAVTYFQTHGMRYRTLRDGQALAICDDVMQTASETPGDDGPAMS